MKRGKKIATEEVTYSLGDLVAALFDETRKISSDQLEQNILVYAALKDLLRRRIRTDHQIALIA